MLLSGVLLVVFESDYLYRVQEQNLFLHTPLFFEQKMVTAGGLLTWTGAYLTQFLYYPMLGAGLLCLFWAFLIWLLKRTFRLSPQQMVVTLVPVACLLIADTCLGYWIFYLKLRGYFFDATIGTIVAVGLAWAYRSLPQKTYLRTAFVPFATCVSYIFFGFYGLWATMLMATMAWCFDSPRPTDSLIAVVSMVAVPFVCYYTLFHQTNIVNIFWVGLPVFATSQGSHPAYYLPYMVLVASTMMMAVASQRSLSLNDYLKHPSLWKGVCGLFIVIAVVLFWYKDDNLHRELSMMRNIERQDWQQVLVKAKGAKGEPTRAMCIMQNLALFRLGLPAEDMLSFPKGAKHPNAPFPVRMVHTYGKLLYLQYGVPNYCYRWCMEDGVEYGWTAATLKLMVKCSLLNGETTAAQRLLNLLKKTDFHRSWAYQYEDYLHNPRLVPQDEELRSILPLLRADDFLTADQSQFELFLIEHILSSPGTTYEQQELAHRTAYYYQHNRCKLVEP